MVARQGGLEENRETESQEVRGVGVLDEQIGCWSGCEHQRPYSGKAGSAVTWGPTGLRPAQSVPSPHPNHPTATELGFFSLGPC